MSANAQLPRTASGAVQPRVALSSPSTAGKALLTCPHTLRPQPAGTNHSTARHRRSVCRAGEDVNANLAESIRNQAAKNFAKGIERGKSEEELVAEQFGEKDPENLSDTQKAYAERVKESLAKRAAELKAAEAERPGNTEFERGKALYGRGRYTESEEVFLEALNISGPYSKLGGEIQLWLALAYQANKKEQLCIDTYKSLEDFHPMPAIKQQAYQLRFIMEAPKLPLGEEDKVKIPVIQNAYTPKAGRSYQPPPRRSAKKVKKSLEEEFMDNYSPPAWVANRYVWAATVILCTGLAWYSAKL